MSGRKLKNCQYVFDQSMKFGVLYEVNHLFIPFDMNPIPPIKSEMAGVWHGWYHFFRKCGKLLTSFAFIFVHIFETRCKNNSWSFSLDLEKTLEKTGRFSAAEYLSKEGPVRSLSFKRSMSDHPPRRNKWCCRPRKQNTALWLVNGYLTFSMSDSDVTREQCLTLYVTRKQCPTLTSRKLRLFDVRFVCLYVKTLHYQYHNVSWSCVVKVRRCLL